MDKLTFLKSSKEEQLNFLSEVKLAGYVLSQEFELAEMMKNFLVKYQKKDFNLDNNVDSQEFMNMLKLVF